jgi:hypothetical protein
MADMNDQHLVLLGEIKGKVDGLASADEQHSEILRSIDSRLRTVEQKAAVNGAVSGGVVSVGMALIIEAARQWMGRGGPGHG